MKVAAKAWIETPLGPVLLGAQEDGLACLFFQNHRGGVERSVDGPESLLHPIILEAVACLEAYFASSERMDLLDAALPLRLEGTPFQRRVWNELRLIPAGKTLTYQELAKRVDAEKSARAVGQAVASNPISIFVPCHRVVGSDSLLRGYAGGLDRKRWLLQHEQGQMVMRF